MVFRIAFLSFSFVAAFVPAAFLLPRLRLGRKLQITLSLFLFLVTSQYWVNIVFGGSMFYPAWPRPVVLVWGSLNCALMVFFFLHLPCYLFFGLLSLRRCRIAAAVVAVFAAAIATVGVCESVKIPRVKEMELEFGNLPPQFDGYRIAQLSDIHCSQITPRSRFEEIVRRTNAAKPDLVCLTGDYADGWVDQLRSKLEPFSSFSAPDGILAVQGNHEYYWGWKEWRPFYEGLGISFLENSWTNIVRGSASIVVAGIPDVTSARPLKRASARRKEIDRSVKFPYPNLEKALSGAPRDAFCVLLAHRPLPMRFAADRGGIALQLSGHTHGGGLPFLSWLVSRWNEGNVRGLYEEDGLKIYVSPGTGQWAGFPLRIMNPSEITVFTLKRRQ